MQNTQILKPCPVPPVVNGFVFRLGRMGPRNARPHFCTIPERLFWIRRSPYKGQSPDGYHLEVSHS
jgi:hypothetical protein